MDQSKRNLLLRGRPEIRLPWSLAGEGFFKTCTRCNLCLDACPENIITVDRFGFPLLDFHLGQCNFCESCRQVCRDAAAEPGKPSAFHNAPSPWSITAHISVKCLATRGTLCRTCGEECEYRAITFSLQTGGFATPRVDRELCTGCGACFHPCPVQAISLN